MLPASTHSSQSSHSNHPVSDTRLTQLTEWLASLCSPALQITTIRPASSDASFRRYFRLEAEDGQSYIAMDAPPLQEDVRPFIAVAKLFATSNLSVPQILAQDVENGFLLLSDLGTVTYLEQFNRLTKLVQPTTPIHNEEINNHNNALLAQCSQLYLDAIDALIMLQVHSQPDVLPEYDRALLQRELMLFPDWYIKQHLGVTLSEAQTEVLNQVFDTLLANNLAQPPVFVHRDYHARNLMVLDAGNPGILDFQDAVYGPITYDLVSLLKDAYIHWEEELVLDWVIRYWERAKRAGLPVHPEFDTFYRDFEFMGMQRHLKVLGIFARLYHRDGKEAYLKDMPLVLHHVRKTAMRYKVLNPLLKLLDAITPMNEQEKIQVGYTF